MILLPVDEAYALDYLSILYVKFEHLKTGIKEEIDQVQKHLLKQMPNLNEIANSAEYRALHHANRVTFDAIELAHRNRISAKDVQDLNHKRFVAKRRLQKKWFPSNKLMERKTLKARVK